MQETIAGKLKVSEEKRLEAESKRDSALTDVSATERELVALKKQVR